MTEKTECNNHRWIPLLGFYKKRTITTSLFTCLICGDLKVGATTIKISRYRLDMGELPIKSVAGINLIEAPTNNQTASGLVVSMTYADTITIGDLLYFTTTGVKRADANGVSTYPVMGLALATASSGSNNVLLHGVYRDDSRYAFTVGGVVYLSTTAGAETQTQPAAINDVIQVVGIATHADRIYFNPSADYLTHT
jgi:hypothetical protein